MSGKHVVGVLRPFISSDKHEAKLRVLRLYKQWIRHSDWIAHTFQEFLPLTGPMVKRKVKEEFMKNKDVKDLRAIDLLLHKGQNDLREVSAQWIQKCHIMGRWFKDSIPEQPNTFMDKFYKGSD